MAYVVDLDTLHGSVVSNDDPLRRMICGRFKEYLAFDGTQFDFVVDDGGPSMRDAIRAVTEGGPFN